MIPRRLFKTHPVSLTRQSGWPCLLIWPVIAIAVLSGCATTAPAVAPDPPPASLPLDQFQPVPNYQYLPNPASAAEREVLARLEQELTYLQRLIREAQDQRNPAARTQFRYELLMSDLETIRHGIRQHLQGPGTEPRTFEPLRGDYRG